MNRSFGAWPSPITAEMAARRTGSASEVRLAGGLAYWLETRPAEGGRSVVMRGGPWSPPSDVTPAGFNARTKVHEYGGGPYWLDGGSVIFTNFSDQRIYRQDDPTQTPTAITSDTGGTHRYADGSVAGGWILCVRERHEGSGDVINELVRIPAHGGAEPEIIVEGHDFFSNPRPSPDGTRMSWLTWDLPDMPWDGTELWVGDLSADGVVSAARRVGAEENRSLFQPEWGPSGELFVVSDRTGWWNLYRVADDDELEPLSTREAEFGVPQWTFGLTTYGFLYDGTIACTYRERGDQHLASLDPNSGELIPFDLPYECFEPSVAAEGSSVAFVGGGPTRAMEVVTLDLGSRSVDVLHAPPGLPWDESLISEPRRIDFPVSDGSASAWFYPPRNPEAELNASERPPLIVSVHGGPTSESTQELDLRTQFWTSRGFAFVNVNYGGSTGSGRAYRERLNGRWGVKDVEDCVGAARYLIAQGMVDAERVAIRGGSAGGYTTLCALTFEPDVFIAGTSYFGLADLVQFAAGGTHKFESEYLHSLVGPWPDAQELYHERSPINFTEKLSRPMLVLQGSEDQIVPPAQSELMVRALEDKNLPHAYLVFEGEQHGFRIEENIAHALEAELSFYGQVFGFEPPGVARLDLA